MNDISKIETQKGETMTLYGKHHANFCQGVADGVKERKGNMYESFMKLNISKIFINDKLVLDKDNLLKNQ